MTTNTLNMQGTQKFSQFKNSWYYKIVSTIIDTYSLSRSAISSGVNASLALLISIESCLTFFQVR